MSDGKIPNDVAHFIYEHIDSAEQLEILLLLRAELERAWTVEHLSCKLITSTSSVAQRLSLLAPLDCIEISDSEPPEYCYRSKDAAQDALIERTGEIYAKFRHSVYGLIFSPLKRARSFASAFTIKKDGGGENG